MPNALMFAFTNPASPIVESEYNRWYTEKHLPDLLRLPGMISATRYKLEKSVEAMPGVSPDPRSYVAIYEIVGETPEQLEEFAQTLRQAIQAGGVDISPALDMNNLSASFALPISDRRISTGKH